MTTWIETTQERYWEMLECLPPEVMTGLGFLVGEPMRHRATGEPEFSAFVKYNGEYYEAKECLTVAEFKAVSPKIFQISAGEIRAD